MAYSNSKNPDLDWSQVRETIKLLNLSAAQVDAILLESEVSVNTLTDSFTEIVESMQAISGHLIELEASGSKDNVLGCCCETEAKVQAAIIAFQFYDRMQQCLQHVTSNLRGLSKLVETPERLYNPTEWDGFQKQIRSRYTMESEKAMFDAILHGKSVEDAIAEKMAAVKEPTDDTELF
jgi:hypothetical protein